MQSPQKDNNKSDLGTDWFKEWVEDSSMEEWFNTPNNSVMILSKEVQAL